MARITKKAVDALLARPREYMLWDDCIKGFGVRVHPSGRKVYLVKFRDHGRAVKRTIGPHGTISPAAARARAAEIVTAARTGRDLKGRIVPPQTESAATVRDLAKRFLEEYVRSTASRARRTATRSPSGSTCWVGSVTEGSST